MLWVEASKYTTPLMPTITRMPGVLPSAPGTMSAARHAVLFSAQNAQSSDPPEASSSWKKAVAPTTVSTVPSPGLLPEENCKTRHVEPFEVSCAQRLESAVSNSRMSPTTSDRCWPGLLPAWPCCKSATIHEVWLRRLYAINSRPKGVSASKYRVSPMR